MLNLLGRLHARPTADFDQIAGYWRIPLDDAPRHRQIGQLYRTMTDPRAARDVWEGLDADERAVVRALSLGDEVMLAVPGLADRLGTDEAAARQTVGRLYGAGILARQGEDETAAPNEEPEVFAPRELALLFRRILDEIDAGDLSTTPLRALLALLDDAEVEEAARTWGTRVIPGLRLRDDLESQILRHVEDPERVAAVVRKLNDDARAIWRQLRGRLEGLSIDLAEAARAAGLTRHDATTCQRLRDALAELEESLLIWHTYVDGQRKLFVPREIRAPHAARPELPPLTPVIAVTVPERPWQPQDALAWDLLTVVRELSMPGAPEIDDPSDVPPPWLRHLHRRLWRRGDDRPPVGYVSFLLGLARAEALLVPRGEDDAVLTVAPSARAWRDLSFEHQTDLLRQRWLSSADWIEGRGRADLTIWGADWRGFRRRLLAQIAALPEQEPGAESETDAGSWYPVEAVAAWIAARDPDLLGPTFTVATARRVDQAGDDQAERRRAAIAESVTVALETAVQWFGIVRLSAVAGQPPLLQVVSDHQAPELLEDDAVAPLQVAADGAISLRRPTPLRVWSLGVFAEPEWLDRVCRYRLTEASFGRAMAAGFDQEQVATFLSRQGGATLPPPVVERLTAWTRQYRRVRLHHAVVVEPDDARAVETLRRIALTAGAEVRSLGERELLIVLPAGEEEALLDAIESAGYAVQHATEATATPAS